MEFMKRLEPVWLTLIVIGALNWLMVGLFDTNVVAEIFGTGTATDVVYVIVGIAGLAMLPRLFEDVRLGARPHAPDRRLSAPAAPGRGCTPGPRARLLRPCLRARRPLPSGRGASLSRPVRYPSDDLTDAERARLAPHVTDLDGPVFALVNLPETVKGALFARYSRYPGTLRRLFLEEFADSLPRGRRAGTATRASAPRSSTSGSSSATATTRSPSSAARTSPASGSRTCSPRCSSARGSPRTWSSRRATSPTTRRCRAAVTATTATPSSGRSTRRRWTRCSTRTPRAAARARVGRRVVPARRRRARGGSRPRRRTPRRSTCCAGCCPPRRSRTWASTRRGQAYEQLILHLIGHPLPEARRYGELILAAIQAVMPSFVSRVERPDRGGAWAGYLAERRAAGERWAARLGLEDGRPRRRAPVGRAHPRRRRRGAAARRAAVRGRGRERGADPRDRRRALATTSAARCCATSSASARTAATAPAAGSRRCATASRSSRTTARSATSSATGC